MTVPAGEIKAPDPDHVQAGVEAAMRHLASLCLWPDDLLETLIPLLSEDYLYLMDPEPRTIPSSDTAKQLLNLKEHGRALLLSMLALQEPAIKALDFRRPTLGEFEALLQKLVEAASRAPSPASSHGRKQRSRPREIAELAADHY